MSRRTREHASILPGHCPRRALWSSHDACRHHLPSRPTAGAAPRGRGGGRRGRHPRAVGVGGLLRGERHRISGVGAGLDRAHHGRIGLLRYRCATSPSTAMEIATLGRLFPDRVLPGIGHGVLDWMGQVGARAASPLTLLEEYGTALRRLLDGEAVTVVGPLRHARRRDAALAAGACAAPGRRGGAEDDGPRRADRRRRHLRRRHRTTCGGSLKRRIASRGPRQASQATLDAVVFLSVPVTIGVADLAAQVDALAEAGAGQCHGVRPGRKPARPTGPNASSNWSTWSRRSRRAARAPARPCR